ncbi:5-formyltetrahydrofolate cyclo-ligase [Lacimicrobium alkaliphilum]|uniref:5-formyltetrahydrofolate cyclo-ligase n=1 Tax=Lacimicrobium alkaliphilum TaxID=1526571 RepID=A0ABQ1QWG5_9ALTE|nr:5-formyltetrahydrofolate cyclo-ligase [Lacimicrobium alkaliphilum]GGD49644.1 5-formyltetrahydrofolate cyclo-ligase [Lacimicrobium alkaliphilum]
MQYSTPQELRQHFRQRRRQLSHLEQQQASTAVLEHCHQLPEFSLAGNIACYLAEDGELDPTPIIDYCWQQKKHLCLPVLHPFCKGHLLFVRYESNTLMIPNRFNISEPQLECARIVPLSDLDIIFTPLVAFDSLGHRMGMGGGFYDRTLAPLYRNSPEQQHKKVSVIGLAHDCQQAEKLTAQAWDLPMQKIITPSAVYTPEQPPQRIKHGSEHP